MSKLSITSILFISLFVSGFASANEWSGYVSSELRLFTEDELWDSQRGNNLSLAFEPEYYHAWNDADSSITVRPFLRIDQHDPERTHFDIRELFWEKAAEKWELRLGIRKVYWGVTESLHLVDIINQTDLIENSDGEEKLGQPMVNLALIGKYGTLDLFMLPGFRERTFAGRRGRLRPPIPVETDDAEYESGAEEWHVDWALRWSKSLGPWDIGLSHFYGTSREPRFLTKLDLFTPKLVPYYDQIHQTGLDAQLTLGSWLWKFEGIVRSGQEETFGAVTAGFEYTFYGAFGTNADIGVLAEYLYDSRGEDSPSPLENDVFLATRISLNDKQSTLILAGGIIDPDSGATSAILEASTRLGNSWRLIVEARTFMNFPEDNPMSAIENDDHLQIELAWYF